MLNRILVISSSFLVLLCAFSTSCRTVDTSGEKELEIVDNYIKAFTSKDITKANSYLADQYIAYGPKMTDSVTVEQQTEMWTSNFNELISSIDYTRVYRKYVQVTPLEVEVPATAGNWVLEWGRMNLTYKDSPDSVTFWWHTAFRVDGGKIDVSRSFYDFMDIYEQRGYTISPPLAGEEIPDTLSTNE